MDWQLSQKKYSPARMDYQARIVAMQDSINSLEGSVELLEEIKLQVGPKGGNYCTTQHICHEP
jgi:hypothetical protein